VEDILACPSCGRHTYRLGGSPLTWDNVFGQYPLAGQREPHPSIPPSIATDWTEAHICLSARTYKASAAMARRAVQGVCIDKGAAKGRLVDQIKALVKSGHLANQLGEWADHVRILGNIGAHPGEDGLDTVSKDEAEAVVRFLDELLRWTYEMPYELEQARQKHSPSL